jgi:hypothetical protein
VQPQFLVASTNFKKLLLFHRSRHHIHGGSLGQSPRTCKLFGGPPAWLLHVHMYVAPKDLDICSSRWSTILVATYIYLRCKWPCYLLWSPKDLRVCTWRLRLRYIAVMCDVRGTQCTWSPTLRRPGNQKPWVQPILVKYAVFSLKPPLRFLIWEFASGGLVHTYYNSLLFTELWHG